MANARRGEELNQVAKLLFDAAAWNWYLAAGLEVAAGVLAIVLTIDEPTGDWTLFFAGIGVILVGSAYCLRLRFENQYDTAETMRRQAAVTEALGWPLDRIQVSRWKQRAGSRLVDRAKREPRDEDYYATAAPTENNGW